MGLSKVTTVALKKVVFHLAGRSNRDKGLIGSSPLLSIRPVVVSFLAGGPAGRNFNRGYAGLVGGATNGAKHAVSSQLVFTALDGSNRVGSLLVVGGRSEDTLFGLFLVAGSLCVERVLFEEGTNGIHLFVKCGKIAGKINRKAMASSL